MRAVFFDLDGTLVELPDDFAAVFESALGDHGLPADSEYHEYYVDAFFDYLGECHPEPYRKGMAALCEEFDLDASAQSLAETYTEREARATRLRSGVHEAVTALDAPDRSLGVLTNGGERSQRRKLTHHEIADHFDAVVVSSEIGASKPDPEIFRAARDAIPADEYVFVADDLERDVLPAQEAGFTGVYLADEGEAEDDRADEIIASLDDVPNVLG